MKAITIWQPYAQAIASGLKKYETRSWPTRYRGPIAIHGALHPMSKDLSALAWRHNLSADLPYGAIVAICEVVDCVRITSELIARQSTTELEFGDWRVGRYAWRLKLLKVLDTPVQIRGAQGLWNISDGTDFCIVSA